MQIVTVKGIQIRYGIVGCPGAISLMWAISVAAQMLCRIVDFRRQFANSNNPVLSLIALLTLHHAVPD